MILHQRTLRVQNAKNAVSDFVVKIWEERDLTPQEVVSILAHLTAEYSKYPLRDQRHPFDPAKKADEA